MILSQTIVFFYWLLEKGIVFDKRAVTIYLIIAIIPVTNIIIHELFHAIAALSQKLNQEMFIVVFPSQVKMRVHVKDSNLSGQAAIKILLAGPIGGLIFNVLTLIIVISMNIYVSYEVIGMLCLAAVINISSLIGGVDGTKIKKICKDNNVSLSIIIKLAYYIFLEILAYMLINRRRENK
jgi:hypothetical protein